MSIELHQSMDLPPAVVTKSTGNVPLAEVADFSVLREVRKEMGLRYLAFCRADSGAV